MAESTRAVIAALLGNAALAILKGTSAAVTGSAAMFAETLHSIADTGNETLLLTGIRLSARPPDDAHPFGHGKNVYFWAFVVSIMLFTLGGAFSIWEAVRHYLHPRDNQTWLWTYGILLAGLVFESASFIVALRALARVKGDRPLSEYWRDSRDPTLLTVLLEDSAAILCLPIAAGGLWLSGHTGNAVWDAGGSALIGLVLLSVAVVLAAENYSLLLGETAPPRVERIIRRVVTSDLTVLGISTLHTMHLGPRRILIVLGVRFARDLRTPQLEEAVARLRRKLADAVGAPADSRLIVIEPTSSGPALQKPA
jgi:cation diffusion facilitator family transporter